MIKFVWFDLQVKCDNVDGVMTQTHRSAVMSERRCDLPYDTDITCTVAVSNSVGEYNIGTSNSVKTPCQCKYHSLPVLVRDVVGNIPKYSGNFSRTFLGIILDLFWNIFQTADKKLFLSSYNVLKFCDMSKAAFTHLHKAAKVITFLYYRNL